MTNSNTINIVSFKGPFRLIGNLIWVVFAGFYMAIGWVIAGIIMAVTIVGIPWAIASFRIASFSLWPFGRKMVDRPYKTGMQIVSMIGNILWILFAGWWLALGHLISALFLAITIIGIPFALQCVKLAGISLTPLGKGIVPIED